MKQTSHIEKGQGGIYAIVNEYNGKFYVGSAVVLKSRNNKHSLALRNNKHCNTHLQRAFNKYGMDCFTFNVIEFVEDKSKLIEQEQMWIDIFEPEYNICRKAGSTFGFRYTPEQRKNVSEKTKEAMAALPPETKAKILAASVGRVVTQDTRDKMSKSQSVKVFSEAHRKALSEARKKQSPPMLGKKHSDKTKELMSKKIKEAFSTPEMQQKLSDNAKKTMARPEVRKKIADAHLGMKPSQETIDKIAETKARNQAAKNKQTE